LGEGVSDTSNTDLQGSTAWTRRVATPLRSFLNTEAGSAGVLIVAIVAALVWANVADGSYEQFWHTDLSITLGNWHIGLTLREWVNSGLMTLFFLVVGLEARREFDLGDLRDRRRFVLPAAAGIAGMILPVGIFLAFNHGGPSRCRPTPRSRSACSRWSGGGCRTRRGCSW
jgi:Na+/H+ antiporter NhaA